MKKRKLLASLLLCTVVSFNTCAVNAQTHELDVAEVINKTYDGYETYGEGGAINNAIDCVIKDSIFTNNSALGGGGGAVFVGSAATVNINNSDFNKNTSNTVGGAIAVRNDSKNNGSNSLTVTNSTFTGNEAVLDGGAIASFIDFTISDSTFDGNTAGRNGGAVSIDFGNPNSSGSNGSVFENVTMTNNSAQNGGYL